MVALFGIDLREVRPGVGRSIYNTAAINSRGKEC